ncbi:MAG: hypothetical protein RJA55_2331 [Acidobacteriota bacterium]|jgi:hypothetical protein
MTVRRFPRSLREAFPRDHAGWLEHHRDRHYWPSRIMLVGLVIALIVIVATWGTP